MDLKKLMVNTKAVWVYFPGLSGFKVEVANLSRKELTGLRKKCTGQKFDRKSRAVVETLDEEHHGGDIHHRHLSRIVERT